MKALIAIAMTLIGTSAIPASPAAPARVWLVNELPSACVALSVHHRSVTASACRVDGRGELWSYRQPFLVSASGLCLTATTTGQVAAAPCGHRGQRWNRTARIRTAPRRFFVRLEPQRYPGYCLALSPAHRGPAQLDPCGEPPASEGGTEYWLFATGMGGIP